MHIAVNNPIMTLKHTYPSFAEFQDNEDKVAVLEETVKSNNVFVDQ